MEWLSYYHESGSPSYFSLQHSICTICFCYLSCEILFAIVFLLAKFASMQSGPDERSIPGNTIAVQADMPYSGLTTFGTAFLSKFECSQMPHSVSYFSGIPMKVIWLVLLCNWNLLFFLLFFYFLCWKLLEHITFVDTPGVLSGEKQRTQRAYDFTGVTSWFAAKCDLILLLFDPHKLDVSDEFRRVISSLRGHDDKIRVVLNKADQVDTQQVRVFVAKYSLYLYFM